jgi:hypothetical protein
MEIYVHGYDKIMNIATVYFERKKAYKKFLRVFKKSAIKAMPKVNLKIIRPKLPKNIDHKRDTAFAFLDAARYAIKSEKPLAIADVDLMFVRSIEDVWKLDFDLAVTVRSSIKYNTGLWFYRPNERSFAFVNQWIKNTKFLMNNFCEYEDYSWLHGGIDQASLHMTVTKNKDAKILELPCQEWNATQSEWKHIDEDTRVIHFKSKLRLATFGRIDINEKYNYMKPLIKKFKRFLK